MGNLRWCFSPTKNKAFFVLLVENTNKGGGISF
jgi:hypothetical protein